MQLRLIIISILLIDSIIGLILGYNNITYILCILNCIVLIITLIISGNNKILSKFLFLLGIIIHISFSTYNIFIWYICFEIILIPMIYLIYKGSGSIYVKNRAIYRFTLYTILGGIILLSFLIILVIKTGSLNYFNYITSNIFSIHSQIILFSIGIIPYLIKLPVIPFHIWLPDTHGEASTSGSVYLAAILLKLGGLGIIRWLIPIFPLGYLYMKPLIIILGIISSVYASIISLRHIDIKKLIAYSSISHMGLILVGITNLNKLSLYGVISLLFSHGLVSASLFLLIGFLYVRTNTRYIYYYSGLASVMPLFSTFLCISLLLNSALPPSLSFIAELHILISQINLEFIGLLHVLFSMLFAGFYSMILFVKLSFSTIKNLHSYTDITLSEFYTLIPLIILSFSLPLIFTI